MKFVTNHWGWSLRGILRWICYGWARPIDVWGVEVSGSSPRRFTRRVKVGPLCFAFGEYKDGCSGCEWGALQAKYGGECPWCMR
jgi:hypothetical protein